MHSAVRFARLTIPMRATKHARQFLLAILICAAPFFRACGRKETARLPEGAGNSPASAGEKLDELPLDQQTEQKLNPLTKEDVDVYLKVMRAGAERVKNLAPADHAALDSAKKILAGSASGRVPTRDDAKTLERANIVAMSMDQIVAEEMKLDGRAYRGIVEAVEFVIPNPVQGAASGGDGARPPGHTPTPLEKRLNDVNASNEKFLAPYREEIQQLIAIVRNPANLPK
jgi:hypothetical protein